MLTSLRTLHFAFSMLLPMVSHQVLAASCNPYVAFIHGQNERLPFDRPDLESTYKIIRPELRRAGIQSALHKHWQAEDDLEHVGSKCIGAVTAGTIGLTAGCVGLSFIFPPLVPACAFIPVGGIGASAGCAAYMLATMGSLGQDLAKQIKKGANPIVLVGHSWGGDTAYEFARYYLARAIEENEEKTKVILITFDAVGEKGEYHRERLSKIPIGLIYLLKKNGDLDVVNLR